MELEERSGRIDRFFAGRKDKIKEKKVNNQLLDLLEGVEIRTSYGSCLKVEKIFDLSYKYSQIPLLKTLDYQGEAIAQLSFDRSLLNFDPCKAVFIDTETTGLSGGVGTYPFLVGIGFFEKDKFKINQYFMRDFNEEGALLFCLRKDLSRFDFLVSYNGKCFDIPLLSTRFIFNRFDFEIRDFLHLDLLYPSRRLWKLRLGDLRLVNLERVLLKSEREDDIPSYLVPQIYFEYLRGEIEPVKKIFEHNLYDILALVELLGICSSVVSDPEKAGVDDPLDLFSLGRLYFNLKDYKKSVYCFESARSILKDKELLFKVGRFLSWSYKRKNEYEKAFKFWLELKDSYPEMLFVYDELAKYYEHKLKEYSKAMEIVDKALEVIESSFDYNYRLVMESFCYRKKRLKRKLKKTARCEVST